MASRDTVEIVINVKNAQGAKKAVGEIGDEMGTLDKNTKKAKDSSADLGKALRALGALAAAKELGDLVKTLIDYNNEINDTSRATGLASETIAGLRLAARGSGQELSTLASGLRQLPKRLSDAKRGTGEALPGFRALGIEAEVVSGEIGTADEVLRAYQERIGSVKNPTEQAAIAVQLFGEAGGQLLVALGDGSDALDKYIERADALGPSLQNGADSAAVAQRAFADLDLAIKGAADSIFEALGFQSGVGSLVQDLTTGIVFFGEIFSQIVTGVVAGFQPVIENFAKAMESILAAFDALSRGDLRGAASNAGQALSALGATALASATTPGSVAGEVAGRLDVGAALDRARIVASGFETTTTAPAGTGGVPITPNTTESTTGVTIPQGNVVNVGLSQGQASDLSKSIADGFVEIVSGPRAGNLGGAFGALGGLMGGNIGGMIPGPIGGALGLITQAGTLGAEGVRENLAAFTDAFVEGLRVLPEILGEVIPEFVEQFVASLIPALRDMLVSLLPGRNDDGTARGPFRELRSGNLGNFATNTLFGMVGGSIARGAVSGLQGSRARGGMIDRTGLYLMHAGERVSSNSGTMDGTTRNSMRGGGSRNIVVNGNVFGSMEGFVRDLDEYLGDGGPGNSRVIGG